MSYPGGSKKKQSRIVVSVDEIVAARQRQKGGGARVALGRIAGGSRRLPIAAFVALALLLVALLGGYLWWQSYKRSPAYSTALLIDAARRDDQQQVARLVDAERIAQSLVPQVLEKAVASVGGMGAVAAPRRQLEAALPNLLAGMRDELRVEFTRGLKDAAEQVGDWPVPVVALIAPRLWVGVREEGEDRALVSLARGENRPPAELTLERDGEHWKMVGLKDDELSAGIARRVTGAFVAQPGANAPPPAGGNGGTRRQHGRR